MNEGLLQKLLSFQSISEKITKILMIKSCSWKRKLLFFISLLKSQMKDVVRFLDYFV